MHDDHNAQESSESACALTPAGMHMLQRDNVSSEDTQASHLDIGAERGTIQAVVLVEELDA